MFDLHLRRLGARLDHVGQHRALLIGEALDGLDQVGDEVGAPLVLVQHLRPRRLGVLLVGGDRVDAAAGERKAERDEQRIAAEGAGEAKRRRVSHDERASEEAATRPFVLCIRVRGARKVAGASPGFTEPFIACRAATLMLRPPRRLRRVPMVAIFARHGEAGSLSWRLRAVRGRRGKSGQHAQFDCGDEHQGRRRQIDARAGPCRDDLGLPRQERAGDRQRRAGERVEHADDGVEPLQAAERRRDHRRLPARAPCSRARRPNGRSSSCATSPTSTTRAPSSCCRATCNSRCSSARCRRRACTRACATVIGELLAGVRKVFDVVLIDCPPGLSVLTESWLREADFHISPTKADYVSVCGLEVFRRFKGLNPEMGFAENLGVIVNMKEHELGLRRGISPLARGQRREPLLRAGDPAHVGAAGRGELPDLRPQLPREVSGPGRRGRARADRGAARAARGRAKSAAPTAGRRPRATPPRSA